MADFVNVPEELYSWIDDDDALKITKKCQIKYWWYAFSDLYEFCSVYDMDHLAGVLSNPICWRKVDGLHGVKIDGRIVGKLLLQKPSRYTFYKKFKIACRCCLKKDIVGFIHDKSKRYPSFKSLRDSLVCDKRGNILRSDGLVDFWLHFFQDRIDDLKIGDLHILEYGFQCAVHMKQPQAMEYFWSKIRKLKESEISDKDNMLLMYAVYAADQCYNRPEIFEFIFTQINPDYYFELLQDDLRYNRCYRSVPTLLNALRLEEFKSLFDCLKPDKISVRSYCSWLQLLGMKYLSGQYFRAAVAVFVHMWEKRGFDEHRSAVYSELAVNTQFQDSILVPLIKNGCDELVFRLFDDASPQDMKKYMNSNNAKCILIMLKERNYLSSLYKYLTYRAIVELENEHCVKLDPVQQAKVTQ